MRTLAMTFGLSAVASWMLTFLAGWLGCRFGVLDHPDKERKLHARATPRTGGLAVCVTLAAALSVCFQAGVTGIDGMPAWPPPPEIETPQSTSSSSSVVTLDTVSDRALLTARSPAFTALLLLSTGLLCGLGLWDDKWGMRARTKFAWQIVAILPFVWWSRTTTSIDLLGWHIEGAHLAGPLILFWLVACTNFVNLIDGLDGLAGTVGLIITFAVGVLAWQGQFGEVALLAVSLAGALSGFLLHNWPPARIFLGDSGSLPLGFLVGALSLEVAAKKAASMTLAVPLVLLSIPMFDTSMAILRRKLNGRKIGQGDRAHIHHCLRDRGLSPTQTLLAIGGLCSATALAAILSTALNQPLVAIGTSAVLLALLIGGRVFGFDETMLLLRQLQAMAHVLRRAPRSTRARFEALRLAASAASGQPEMWNNLVKRARRLPGVAVEFGCEHLPTGRKLASFEWVADEPADDEAAVWRISYSVPRGGGICARGEARGLLRPGDDPLAFHELAEMLTVLCRNWPVRDMLDLPAESPTDHSFEEPRILSPHWPSARRKRGALGGRGVDRDAA